MCSACQNARYCSTACQRNAWKKHKVACKKVKQQVKTEDAAVAAKPEQRTLSEVDQDALVRVIRSQFVDISKILGLVDSNKAEEFKVRNKAAKAEHDKKHDHGHEEGHSCGDHARKYYISEEHMSYVDKTINSKISTDAFFRKNLVTIITRAREATCSIQQRAKQRGMELEDDQMKELHAKAMLETVNRLIFQEVYAELKQSDQSFSKQPGLVAHPGSVMQMPDCNLEQLSGNRFTQLMHNGYAQIDNFFDQSVARQVLGPVMQLVHLLEMEGKFTIRRPRHAADVLTRVDKFLEFSLQQLE